MHKVRAAFLISVCIVTACQTKPKISQTDSKSDLATDSPKLMKPVVKRIWIPRKIEEDGRVMIDGHWRFEVSKGSSWSN